MFNTIQTTHFNRWQEFFYLLFPTNAMLTTWFNKWWYKKFHGTTETTQTTPFNRWQEYFYLLFPINARLQPNSNTYVIRNFIYTKHNGDNPNKHDPSKHNPNNQNNDINVGFTTTTKFVVLLLKQRKFRSIHIQISTNFKKFIFNPFRAFDRSPICVFYRLRKTCTWLDEQFGTLHPSLDESVTSNWSQYKNG